MKKELQESLQRIDQAVSSITANREVHTMLQQDMMRIKSELEKPSEAKKKEAK